MGTAKSERNVYYLNENGIRFHQGFNPTYDINYQ